MTSVPPGIREYVLRARNRWIEGRKIIRSHHDEGAAALSVVRRMSDLLDQILLDLYERAVSAISTDLDGRVAVVLHGGNGRREVAPYSDVDLMVLYQGSLTEDVAEFSRRFMQDITDMRVALGYSLRTPRDACSRSLKDPETFTSLIEARYLAGNEQLFENFYQRFQRIATRRTANVISGIIAARQKERVRFGESVYLLRPNVKKSRGALRDIHLIRWLAFVRYGIRGFQQLLNHEALTEAETRQLAISNEFLLRVRNELHFHNDRAMDQLGRNEQVRIAEKFGYRGSEGVLPVEDFMRDYFRCTSRIHYLCEHFTSTCENRRTIASSLISPMVTKKIDDHFHMGPNTIGVEAASLDEVKGDLSQVLHLMQLCGLHDKQIEHETWSAIRESMLESPVTEVDQASARRFMALLSNTRGLASQLRKLHEMKVLRKLIPGFNHARGLLQFNEYHHYTVDEHSIRVVWEAVHLEEEQSIVGETYRQIRRKDILHLALLLHDLGKGFAEDHSEVGGRIADETGKRLGLDPEDTEDIKFLVHNHLVMSHLAFHRDINDDSMVAEFASNVASLELLDMLFVLTCADIAAVGPGVLNDWKKGLLTSLYLKAKSVFTGEPLYLERGQELAQLFDAVSEQANEPELKEWLRQTVANLPGYYFDYHSPEQIAHQLTVLHQTSRDEVQTWVTRQSGTKLIELCIGKYGERRSGLFYKLTGMLASMGLTIRSADIKPLGNSLVWYWFQFEDGDFADPPDSRLEDIRLDAHRMALGISAGPPTFRTRLQKKETVALKLSRPEIKVRVNNHTVDTATIIDVFAYNKSGLLYKISKKIYQMGLDVTFARISTYAHQVIDVFYVTDDEGNKIRNENQVRMIKQEILKTVKDFLEPDPRPTDEI